MAPYSHKPKETVAVPTQPQENDLSHDEEVREYATTLILDHARYVERSTIREMAEDHFGPAGISDEDTAKVRDLIAKATITVDFSEASPVGTQPRYFLATDTDDGSGSMALWRNRDGEPDRPDPVLYQHSADPGVWDAAVALLVRRDADANDWAAQERSAREDQHRRLAQGAMAEARQQLDFYAEMGDHYDARTYSMDVVLEAGCAWHSTGLVHQSYSEQDVNEIAGIVAGRVATVLIMAGWQPPAHLLADRPVAGTPGGGDR